MTDVTRRAIELGLLQVLPHASFPGRNGNQGRPYLADVRGAIASRELRRIIVSELQGLMSERFPTCEAVVGIAKGGIAWAALLGWVTDLPTATLLLEGPRKSGRGRQIEGDIAGKACVIIDNVVRSGKSIDDAAHVLKSHGITNLGCLTIVNDGPPKPSIHAVWSMGDLLTAAHEMGRIDTATLQECVIQGAFL